MRITAATLGASLLVLAAIVACDGPPTIVETSYDVTTQTLTLALSDGTEVKSGLLPLATDAELMAALTALQADIVAGFTTPTPTPIPTSVPAPAPIHTGIRLWDGTLHVGFGSLGPYVATLYDSGPNQSKFAALTTHETLFVMDYGGVWAPRLIKSFDVSPNGLTYTMYLQEGAEWHGGNWGEFNADDFIWSIGEVSREGSNHVQAGNTHKVFACDGCVLAKIDDHTVELKRPTSTFQLTLFSQAPLPSFSMNSKRHFESVAFNTAIHQDVGTGPWQQVEYRTDEIRIMRAVENHWRKTPEFGEMVWWDIPEESVRLANFQTGFLDTGVFNSDSIRAMKDSPVEGQSFMTFPFAIIQMLWHEGGHYTPDSPHHQPNVVGYAPVPIDHFYGDYRNICDDSAIIDGVSTAMSSDDRRPWISCNRDVDSPEWERARMVREAMLRAIDRVAILNNIAFGEGEPSYLGYWANRGRMQQLGLDQLGPGDMDYDQTAARKLLAEAGYPDGFAVRVNKRLGTGTLLLVKDAVASDWLELGLDVTLHNQEPAAYRVQSQARRTIDIYGLNDAPSFPEPLNVYSLVYSSAGGDMFGVNHADLDRLISIAETTLHTDERWRVQGEIARFIYENVLAMPLYAENGVWPLGAEVDHWQVAPAGLDWLSYWEDARVRRR